MPCSPPPFCPATRPKTGLGFAGAVQLDYSAHSTAGVFTLCATTVLDGWEKLLHHSFQGLSHVTLLGG